MWAVMENGEAIDNLTGDEMYYELGTDGLIRVYQNHKPIHACKTVTDAKEFIKKRVDELNEKGM